MYKQIEQRQGLLAFSEKKVALVEAKMAELSDKAGTLDQTIKGILARQAVVRAVKTEVDSVHEISARSRADLQFVTDHRDEVAAVRSQINDLLTTARETEEKVAAIEGRQETVDEVQAKTNLISNLLEDVSVNLDRNFHFELHLHPKTYASYPVVSIANRPGLFEVVVRHILAVLRSRCAGFACPACLAADTCPARPLPST